jgi:hypothetical protein
MLFVFTQQVPFSSFLSDFMGSISSTTSLFRLALLTYVHTNVEYEHSDLMSCSFSLSRTLVLGSLGNSFELYLCDMIKIIDEMHRDSIADDAAETLMLVSSLFEGNDDPTLNYVDVEEVNGLTPSL